MQYRQKNYIPRGGLAHFLVFISLIIFSFALYGCGDSVNVAKKLSKVDQNASHYVNPDQSSLITSAAQQSALAQNFLKYYFSPWGPVAASAQAMNGVLAQYRGVINNYKKHPGWGVNANPLSPDFIQSLATNADLANFPNINQPGIIVHRTFVRSLPTLLPSFGNPQQAGEGYPFDNWQESYIAQGSPVRVLHQSKDKLWYLIVTSSYSGWVPSQDVGLVSADFVTKWQSFPFVITTKDGVALTTANHLSPAAMRVGVLYPNPASTDSAQYEVLMPMLDTNGMAQMIPMFVDKTQALPFPLALSASNIAAVAQNFIGTSYGWGGLYDQRDCSATTQDLFATFGIWLPRNSGMQSRRGQVISIAGLTQKEKLAMIEKYGIPFLTLIQGPGHITLYIGMRNGVPYILQDAWGLHTYSITGKEGRAVIGKTVITPVDFGQGFINVKTFLDKANAIIILRPENLLNK